MSLTERFPVAGKWPPCAMRLRVDEKKARAKALINERARKPDKQEEFVAYDSEDEEDEQDPAVENTFLRTSYSFIDYVRSREFGLREKRKVTAEYPTRHIISHELFKEYPIPLNNMNKVFCSQWLSDKQIVFGTKCNKVRTLGIGVGRLR